MGTGICVKPKGKLSAACRHLICAAQVELLVQSRNVRERLDGDQPLQDIPERPSQEALLSQQEHMLQEVQTSQGRLQGQPSQAHTLPVPSDPTARSSQGKLHEPCGNRTKARSQRASPASPSDHADGARDKVDSNCNKDASQDSAMSLPQAAAMIEQPSQQRQHLSQAAQPQNKPMQAGPPVLAAPEQQLSAAVSAQELEQATQGAVGASAAAAPCLGTGASGVLTIDDSDDLEYELAQQVEDAAKAARSTQHAQQAAHAQLDAGSKSGGFSPPALMQIEQPALLQANHKPAVQPTTNKAGVADPNSHQTGPAEGKSAAAAVAAQQGSGQFNTFNGSCAFQHSDMEIDDDLAQLLDAATALRPAGPPSTALAGPGPASTSSSRLNSSSNSPRSLPNSAGSRPGLSGSRPKSPATLHQAVPTHGTHLPQQRPLDPPIQAMEVLPEGRHQPGGITSPVRESEDGMLALEPAGPADLVDLNVSVSCHTT